MPIFDQGYQHWSGHLSGHAWRWLAISRRGLQTVLKGKLVRLTLLVCWLPAIVLAFVLCMWGLIERQSEMIIAFKPYLTTLLGRDIVADPRAYRADIWTICYHYFFAWQLWFAMVLVLLAGPNLISQDLRYNALPLYFSRPLRRIDYFLGKLGIIVGLIGLAMIGPAVLTYILGLLFSLDITIIRDTYSILLASLAYGVILSVSAGLLVLAFSATTRNSRYVALLWLAMLLISSTVSFVLVRIDQAHRLHASNKGFRAWRDESFVSDELKAEEADWRSLVSYTANLSRVQEQLLRTNKSWRRLADLSPTGTRSPILQKMLYTQHPWYWSAGVLVSLAAFSACTLNLTVKSLDRLK
ncbi:MAG: hypothetical protein U0805_09210 [Pirellulales bacterium]